MEHFETWSYRTPTSNDPADIWGKYVFQAWWTVLGPTILGTGEPLYQNEPRSATLTETGNPRTAGCCWWGAGYRQVKDIAGFCTRNSMKHYHSSSGCRELFFCILYCRIDHIGVRVAVERADYRLYCSTSVHWNNYCRRRAYLNMHSRWGPYFILHIAVHAHIAMHIAVHFHISVHIAGMVSYCNVYCSTHHFFSNAIDWRSHKYFWSIENRTRNILKYIIGRHPDANSARRQEGSSGELLGNSSFSNKIEISALDNATALQFFCDF